MTRLMRLMQFVYGENMSAVVFEPLLADAQAELRRDNRSRLLALRWFGAIAWTMIRCLPAATFRRLPQPLVVDLTARALAFGTLAFELQWFLGARLGPESGATAWPPSFATTVPFVVIPLIWRLRSRSVPVHQQRLLTIAITLVSIVGAWVTTPANPSLRVAMTFALTFLAFNGWRLATLNLRGQYPFGRWMTGFYAAASLIIASLPIKLALGISVWRPWWPGDNFIPYVVGVLIAMAISGPATQRSMSP